LADEKSLCRRDSTAYFRHDAHLGGGGTLAPAKTGLIPGILVSIRKDLRKIYINGVYYQYE